MRVVIVLRILPMLSAGLLFASSAHAIPLLPDTFEDGTTMGWFVPDPSHPAPPANQPGGGPGGVDDAYLELTAVGGQLAGSRLSVLNDQQWMGDYMAAGITAITMDVNNFGPDDVVLRLLLENFPATPGPPTDLAVTVADVVVPAASGWVSVSFDLSPANLFALAGSVDGALGDVNTLRLFHNPDPDHPGPFVGPPAVNAVLGVDNIRAVGAVPEPVSGLLFGAGLAAYLIRRRCAGTPV